MSPEDKKRQSFDNHHDGLYSKYHVYRLDESDKHNDCEYFVLDLTHDPFARIAIAAYALNCEAEYPELAQQLRRTMLRITHERRKKNPGCYPDPKDLLDS